MKLLPLIFQPLIARGRTQKLLFKYNTAISPSISAGFATKSDSKAPKDPKDGSSQSSGQKTSATTTASKPPSSTGSQSHSAASSSKGAGDGNIKAEDYKVQEYFKHSPFTFYDFEKKMVGDRLKQPSPFVKEGQAAPAEAKK